MNIDFVPSQSEFVDRDLRRICWFREEINPALTESGIFPTSGSKYLKVYRLFDIPRLDLELQSGGTSASTKGVGFFLSGLRSSNLVVRLNGMDPNTGGFFVPVTVPQGPGGVCFFGVVAESISSIDLRSESGEAVPFGIDDLAIALPGLTANPGPSPASLRLDRDLWGLWMEGSIGAWYRIEYVPQSLGQAPWRSFSEFVLPASPHLVLRIDITNRAGTSFFRVVGINPPPGNGTNSLPASLLSSGD